jgi:hypothetical protein
MEIVKTINLMILMVRSSKINKTPNINQMIVIGHDDLEDEAARARRKETGRF